VSFNFALDGAPCAPFFRHLGNGRCGGNRQAQCFAVIAGVVDCQR